MRLTRVSLLQSVSRRLFGHSQNGSLIHRDLAAHLGRTRAVAEEIPRVARAPGSAELREEARELMFHVVLLLASHRVIRLVIRRSVHFAQ